MRTAIVIVYRTQNLSAERLFEARRTKTGALLGVLRNCTKFKIFEQQQHAASGGIPPAPPFFGTRTRDTLREEPPIRAVWLSGLSFHHHALVRRLSRTTKAVKLCFQMRSCFLDA